MRFLYGGLQPRLESLCGSMPSTAQETARLSNTAARICLSRLLASRDATPRAGRIQMMDVILLALCAALFAVSIGYAYACERL